MEVKFNDLTKKFGNFTAVDHLTMTMTNGVYGLLGVNGAGKTTLFKILIGETSYDGGELYIKKEARVGYLQQDVTVESEKTIYLCGRRCRNFRLFG